MAGDYIINYRVKFSLFGFIDHVVFIYTRNRLVCGYFNNVQLVYFLEFRLLCHGGTRHTRKLVVKAEEILEGNGCKGF